MLFLRLKTTTSWGLLFNQVMIKIRRTTFCQFWGGASLQSFWVHGGLWQSPQALSALVGLSGVVSDSTDDCSSGSSPSLSLQKKNKTPVQTTHSVSILPLVWLVNKGSWALKLVVWINSVVNFHLGMNKVSIHSSINTTSPVYYIQASYHQ